MIRYRFTSTIPNESRDSQNSIEHYYTINRNSFIDKLYKNLYKISLLKGHENFKFQNFYLIFTLSHLFPALKIFPHLIHFFSITRYSVMQTRIVFPLSTELTLTAELIALHLLPTSRPNQSSTISIQNACNICHLPSMLHLTPNIPNYAMFCILEIYESRN